MELNTDGQDSPAADIRRNLYRLFGNGGYRWSLLHRIAWQLCGADVLAQVGGPSAGGAGREMG